MKAANGNYAIAAAALDSTDGALRAFIARDQQLASIWLTDMEKVDTPDEADLMTRAMPTVKMDVASVINVDSDVLGEAALRQDREILRAGLQSAGIKAHTINKLGLMENFAANTGRFLGASLDMTHRVTVFQGVALFERAEYIKEHYLEDETLPHEVRIEWQKAYNEVAELIAKTSDRVLAGTQAAVSMLRKKEESDGGASKGKPGFQPLKNMKTVKQESHGDS